MNAREIIRNMQLLPHPEGGYYRETYRSPVRITTPEGKVRNVSTSIYYLLENEDKSHFHRLSSDETWYFHQGEALEIITIREGKPVSILLGNDVMNGEAPQAIIPAHTWFAAQVRNSSAYSLVSCSVSPGFDFSDFEMGKREELTREFPGCREVILAFT
jgi:predicted cupin superfamily sugar epimerase